MSLLVLRLLCSPASNIMPIRCSIRCFSVSCSSFNGRFCKSIPTVPRSQQKQYFRSFATTTTYFSERLYTNKHEWIVNKDGTGTIGISDHAQSSLGDIVYVQLPEVGEELEREAECGAVESVKAASDIYSPASGTVSEINVSLIEKPSIVNKSPLENGWLFKMKLSDPSELDSLMSEEAYKTFLKESDDGYQ